MDADENDFNKSAVIVTFPADEGRIPADLLVPIPILDDIVDEADDQFFVVQLVVVSTFKHLIIGRATSNCIIVDNDREE